MIETFDLREVTGSINGFDEIAISKAFRQDLDKMTGSMPTRAAIFTHLRRIGVKDNEAYKDAMGLTIAEIEALFRDQVEAAEGDRLGEDKTVSGPNS